MLFRALASHRVLFAIAGTHWASGMAMVPFLRTWAFVVLLAGATLTLLAGQRLAVRQRAADAEGWRKSTMTLAETQAKLVDAVAAYAQITVNGRRSDTGSHLILPRDGARPVPLRAVEDDRSEPA